MRHKPTAVVRHDWAGDVIKVMGGKDGGGDGGATPNPPSSASLPSSFQFILYFIINVIIILVFKITVSGCIPAGYPPRVRVRVYPGSENGYPPRYPYPRRRVWVFAGMGTGTGKSTRGLP